MATFAIWLHGERAEYRFTRSVQSPEGGKGGSSCFGNYDGLNRVWMSMSSKEERTKPT